MKILAKYFSAIIIAVIINFTIQAQTSAPTNDINTYIHTTWDALTRTHQDLAKMVDVKIEEIATAPKSIVYISSKENLATITQQLQSELPASVFKQINIEVLPQDVATIKNQGILYLPYPFVVPGGRFNEMYGWDSYFIVLGLLEDNRVALAKDIVNNFIYEINYYGTVLNANRSYYLQRSQPPLLTEMILAVYQTTHDKAWLQSTLPAVLQFYDYWLKAPRLVSDIGLSRYYADGEGPSPEVTSSENFYPEALSYFKNNAIHSYDIASYYDSKSNTLKPAFYKSDRTVRESGFDLSGRYGPLGAMITNFVPIDLNSLLYEMESNIATIYQILQQPKQVDFWKQKASTRKQLINHYLWDPTLGYYFDYDFINQRQYPYIFATTFYPLWAGIASPAQAAKVVQNLPSLERPGGIVSSAYVTGYQWDAPFAWAPLQYFAVVGLARYGYCEQAKRIATDFMTTVNKNYELSHTIVEKYNLASNDQLNVKNNIAFGYLSNEIGFGWTNGVYAVFADFLAHPKMWCQIKQPQRSLLTKNIMQNA